MNAVSLFAGVGGFDLALERNGIPVVASVEIDKHALKVLARHFPKSKLFTDVKEVSGGQLIEAGFTPDNGIIVGGFPCQDVSVAGRRAGLTPRMEEPDKWGSVVYDETGRAFQKNYEFTHYEKFPFWQTVGTDKKFYWNEIKNPSLINPTKEG